MIKSPKTKTIKKLFVLSGNRCAFPECSNSLVDTTSGKVTGRICHIKGKSAQGPRYDPNQIGDERHSYENLILLCPEHHDIIDDNPSKYTVDFLYQIKKEHESKVQKVSEPNNSILDQFLLQLDLDEICLIMPNNQRGGQVAQTIINNLRLGKQIDFKVINKVVCHIISICNAQPTEANIEIPIKIQDKINLNKMSKDFEDIFKQHLVSFNQIEEFLKSGAISSHEINKMLFSLKIAYMKFKDTTITGDKIFEKILDYITPTTLDDNEYYAYGALLCYFFHTCEVFERVSSE